MITVDDTNEEHTGMTKAGENETTTEPEAEDSRETGYFGFADDPDALGMANEDDPDDPTAGGLLSLKDIRKKENG